MNKKEDADNPKNIIFIGGVHGVGKSSFCSELSKKFNIEHITASSLIKRRKSLAKDKQVDNVIDNQAILVEELSTYKSNKRVILLDGHFTLLKSKRKFEDVPLDTFKSISPKAIALLSDSPENIAARISNRDGKNPISENEIELLQNREIERAKIIQENLRIPLIQINPIERIDKLISLIEKYMQQGVS